MRLPGARMTLRGTMIGVAALAAYLAAYRALVLPDIAQPSASYPGQVAEIYLHSPRLCAVVFTPANRLDRALRPRSWARPACVW